jgi:hypothetical protein
MRRLSPMRGPLIAALLIPAIMTAPLAAQDLLWSVDYGGTYAEEGYAVAPTTDGGYAVLGSTYSFGAGDHDIYILRLDSLGDTLWSETFGGPGTEYGYDIQTTSDGGFIVCGSTRSWGAGKADVYLLKLNFLGGEIWSKTYGGVENDVARSVRLTSDGGFVVAGSTASFGAGYDDFWMITYGGAGGETAFAVRPVPGGGYILTGATGSFGEGYSSMYAVRTDGSGDTLWTRTYGGSHADMAYSVENTPDGGFAFVGATASYGAGEYDVYLVKTGPDGDQEWDQYYGGSLSDRGYSVQPTADGGYFIAGSTASYGSGPSDLLAIKTDPLGGEEWRRNYGGSKADYCQSAIASGHSWVLVGYTFSYGAGSSDVYLTRIRGEQATPVEELPDSPLPNSFVLEQNYPNPFNLGTTIEFELSARAPVSLTVYNILGQAVWENSCGVLSPGPHRIYWDGLDRSGGDVATGVYLYSLSAGEIRQTRKMILLK